jgi:iron complex outermembrane receptor protein
MVQIRRIELAATAALRASVWAVGYLALTALPARSADGPSQAAGEAAGADLTTIIVTAQKRSEDVQDVALAVAALDGAALRDAGVSEAMQLQDFVPSLTYLTTGYTAQPYLRGIGTRQSTVGLEPSVATYIDDRYVPRPFGAIFDMLDVERVEVLKGPQGTLYGRNAAGGAIRAVTKDPGREPSLEVAARVGDYDYARLGVVAGGPLTRALRGQIAAGLEQRDGFATNLVPTGRPSADDVDRENFRAKLLWDGEAVSAKLAVSSWKYTDWSGRDVVSAGPAEANRGVALYGGVTSRDRSQFATALTADNDLRETAADLRFDARLGKLDLVSITTYTDDDFDQTFDLDASSASLVDLVAAEPSETWSQEFQLVSPTDANFAWLTGLYYYHQDASNTYLFADAISAQPQSPLGTDVSNGLQRVVSKAHALFAQGTYAFNASWALTLGGRLSRETKDATLDAVPNTITNAPTPFADARTWDEFTPRVVIEYRPPLGLVYLSYSRGFKSGGYNYPASLNPVLDPEVVESYELGLKSDLFERRLRIAAALFVYDYRDLQVTRGGDGVFLATENAADARVRGLELDVELTLATSLALEMGVALLDSEYVDYTAGVLVPVLGPPYGSAPLRGGLDVRGRSLLRAPDEALHIGLRYDRRLTRGGRLPLRVDYAYKGDYYFDFAAVPETEWLRQKAYGVLDVRYAYVAPSGRWEIGLWGANVTDEAYYEDAVLSSFSSRVSYADPRTYGVDFKFRL